MTDSRCSHISTNNPFPFLFMTEPTPVFLPGESQGRGAWRAAVYGVAQSRTRLKRLSSSTSSRITCGFYFILQAFILNSYFFNEHVLFLYYSLNICLLFSCLVKRGRTEGGEKRDILIMFFIFRKQLA